MSRRRRGSSEGASGVKRVLRDEAIESVVEVARLWHEAGYAVLPSHEDGTGRPCDQHRSDQGTRSDWAELEAWLTSGRYPGIGVLTGAISGNAEMIEIAGPPERALATVTALLDCATELGTRSLLDRAWNGCTEQSADGGIRTFIRVAGGHPLCSRPLAVDRDATPAAWTRGEGDFVIVGSTLWTGPRQPGTPVHALVEDRVPSMTVTIAPEERDVLHLTYGRVGYSPVEHLPATPDLGGEHRGVDLAICAVTYARAGVPVFPLAPRTKKPMARTRGFHDATCRIEQVEAWWQEEPESNIGAPTGVAFDVLDFDVKVGLAGDIVKDSRPHLARLNTHALLAGAIGTARTRHDGLHVFYPPSGRAKSKIGGLHIDFQAKGGYVVLPPSLVAPDDGYQGTGRYEWLDPLDFRRPGHAPLDWEAVVSLLQPRIAHAVPVTLQAIRAGIKPVGIDGLVRSVATSKEGERNDVLFWAACRAVEGGLDTAALASAARATGLADAEISRTIRSAKTHAVKGTI